MIDKEKNNHNNLEKGLNVIIKKKYPFIRKIEIIRTRQLFSELQADIVFYVDYDFIEDYVDFNCYDQMIYDSHIFFSLFSFNHCSKIKIDEEYIYGVVETTYKMMGLNHETIYRTNLSLSVVSEVK